MKTATKKTLQNSMWLLSANTRKKFKKMKINPKTNVRLVMNKLLLKSYMITESKQKKFSPQILLFISNQIAKRKSE